MKNLKVWIFFLFEHFIIYIPLIILIILSGGYIYLLSVSPTSTERLRFLIGLDAAVATMAGLSLYASYTSADAQRKSSYYKCGEQLFHASVLIFIATFMRGCILLLDDFAWYTQWRTPIQIVFVTVTAIFFFYGLFHLTFGLKNLLHFIHKIKDKTK